MAEERLYFNGINGATGMYGLAPMTATALAQKISEDRLARSDQVRKAENILGVHVANLDKAAGLAQLLAESSLQILEGKIASRDAWLEMLARRTCRLILGDDYADEGTISRLQEKLGQDTVAVLGAIVKQLVTTGGHRELARLLLSDQDADYKEYLKQDTDHKLAVLINTRLGQEALADAEQGGWGRWLDDFVRALEELPIDSLGALKEHSQIVTQPLKTLLDDLDGLARQNRELEACIARLDELYNRGGRAAWRSLVDILRHGLAAQAPEAWPGLLAVLKKWLQALRDVVAHYAAVEWVDPTRLEQAGWGIILPAKMDAGRKEAIMQSLAPLLQLRQKQAGKYYKTYQGADGYRPRDTASSFLSRHGARASDPANPECVPYYLLIAGNPEEIPFQFQYQLDVQYAVGRIDFGDDWAAYANYARNVAAAESGAAAPPRAAFFAVQNPGDQATAMSAAHLVEPLYERFKAKTLKTAWQFERIPPQAASKARLLGLMKGEACPALLFTASHGMEFDAADPEKQRRCQGALLCGDWNGQPGPISPDCYLAGQDIRDDGEINLQGVIAFFFACYGAGTPLYDEYYKQDFKETGQAITEHPFVADLPKAMLGLARGALAVVGHLERAWGTSFLGDAPGPARPIKSEHVAVFESALERLLNGHPLGSAMEYFNARYAALSTELTVMLDGFAEPNAYDLAALWTANNDARGYLIIGDPAVRLRAAQAG